MYEEHNLTPNKPRTINTEETLNKIRELHNEGKTIKEMVKILGFSDKTIGEVFKKLNLSSKRFRKLTDDEILFIKNNINKLTKTTICNKLRLTPETYKRETERLGLK